MFNDEAIKTKIVAVAQFLTLCPPANNVPSRFRRNYFIYGIPDGKKIVSGH
jgi:hypothetical protein